MPKLTFDGQREGEEVQLVFRRHISTINKGFVFLAVMIGLGVLPLIMWPGDSRMFWVFIGAVVVGLFGLFYAYILWYFSMYIVTNERIRQISQKGLFKKTVVDLGLDKILSMSVNVPGPMAGMSRYGTILIQTGVGDLIISKVPKPYDIHNKLQDIAKEAEK